MLFIAFVSRNKLVSACPEHNENEQQTWRPTSLCSIHLLSNTLDRVITHTHTWTVSHTLGLCIGRARNSIRHPAYFSRSFTMAVRLIRKFVRNFLDKIPVLTDQLAKPNPITKPVSKTKTLKQDFQWIFQHKTKFSVLLLNVVRIAQNSMPKILQRTFSLSLYRMHMISIVSDTHISSYVCVCSNQKRYIMRKCSNIISKCVFEQNLESKNKLASIYRIGLPSGTATSFWPVLFAGRLYRHSQNITSTCQ